MSKLYDFSKFAKDAKASVPKITRDAFIYLEPASAELQDRFAQCKECRMWVPGYEGGGCIIHGSKQVPITASMSCALFVAWPEGTPDEEAVKNHLAELQKDIPGAVTPEQSGLVNREVRCQNCAYFDDTKSVCGLFEKLNKAMPDIFDLKIQVSAYGCCNAQEPRV